MIDMEKCFRDVFNSKSFEVIESESGKYDITKYELTFNVWKG